MPDYILVNEGRVVGTFAADDAACAHAHAALGGDLYVKVGDPDKTITQEIAWPDWISFGVTVEPLTDGFRVKVRAGGASAAEIVAEDLKVALACALPFMELVAAPDPFEEWLRQPPAQDGPPEVQP